MFHVPLYKVENVSKVLWDRKKSKSLKHPVQTVVKDIFKSVANFGRIRTMCMMNIDMITTLILYILLSCDMVFSP